MGTYAQDTSVSTERSRAEIERTLQKYGAGSFMYGSTPDRAVVAFEMKSRRIRFDLPLPDFNSKEFKFTPARNNRRSEKQHFEAWEQACRQRWRALSLCIKAKLEAVECGITTFEDEFMAHIVLPSGQRAGEWMAPQIERAYQTGEMPPLLPAPGVMP